MRMVWIVCCLILHFVLGLCFKGCLGCVASYFG